MTAINFVSFLVALIFIDMRNSMSRSHCHSKGSTCPLPAWLHAVLFHRQPCPAPRYTDEQFYHSKQKKLFKMEAEEAFRVRKATIVAMGAVAVGASASGYYVVGWIVRSWGYAS